MNELTDVCEEGAGWVYPGPPIPDGCDTNYHDEIVAILTIGGTPSLEGLSTAARAITCTLITIAIEVDGAPEAQQWRLDAGPADVGDPGQVAPADYNLTTNNKRWVKVG